MSARIQFLCQDSFLMVLKTVPVARIIYVNPTCMQWNGICTCMYLRENLVYCIVSDRHLHPSTMADIYYCLLIVRRNLILGFPLLSKANPITEKNNYREVCQEARTN